MSSAPVVYSAVPTLFGPDGELDPGGNRALYRLIAGLVDGIDRRLADELGEPATFIATGGLAPTIAPHCETIDEVDPLLTLTGLRLIYERNAA